MPSLWFATLFAGSTSKSGMLIKPEDIRPAKDGKSDFFSWQLFRWVRKYRCGRWNEIWQWPSGTLYIGMSDNDYEEPGMGWLSGRMLRNVCSYGQDLKTFAHPIPARAKDVTGAFWTDYMRRGVCAIHPDIVHVWDYCAPNRRRCKYCAKTEQSYIVTAEQIKWEPVSLPGIRLFRNARSI